MVWGGLILVTAIKDILLKHSACTWPSGGVLSGLTLIKENFTKFFASWLQKKRNKI